MNVGSSKLKLPVKKKKNSLKLLSTNVRFPGPSKQFCSESFVLNFFSNFDFSLSFLDIQNENYFQKPRLLYQPNQASPENNKGYEKLTFSNEK